MSTISGLHSHVGYLLRLVSNAVSHEFARRVAEQDVTVAEWSLMRTLYDTDAVAPTILADRMGMTKGAISKLAERLLAKGLVARTDDPGDKRAHKLSLTAIGREKTPVLAMIADGNDAEFFGVLTNDEKADLRNILQALIDRRQLKHTPVD